MGTPVGRRGTFLGFLDPSLSDEELAEQIRAAISAKRHTVPMNPVPAARHLQRGRDLADLRYAEPITVSDMAEAAGLSRAHFSREFTKLFGESPHRYLMTRRLERAAALLRSTERSVADICFMVGLQSVGSFTTSFRRMYDMTPTQYRASFPPAAHLARIPTCVVRTYARPEHRTFREDEASSGS